MKFPIFASFIVFVLWLTYELRKTKIKSDEAEESFWDKEQKANHVRKKSLEDLPYVRFDFTLLPDAESIRSVSLEGKEEIRENALASLEALMALQNEKILNLNGISNTDVKLTYGTANLAILTEYDLNFETFSKHIYLLANALDQLNLSDKALTILEETLYTGTDVSGHYKLLANLYKRKGQSEKIAKLRQQAETLTGLSKKSILSYLDTL